MTVHVSLLGTITVRVDAQPPAVLAGTQAQVAFARLVLERHHGTSRDQLADTIWPTGLPLTWSSALRSVVSRVRSFVTQLLDAQVDPIVSREGQFSCTMPFDVVVDVEIARRAAREAMDALDDRRFDDAVRAAELAVANLQGSFIPDHDSEWLTATRHQLDELLVTSLETAATAAAHLGKTQVAVQHIDEAIRRQPLREGAHRCRMQIQMNAGNRAEALRTYQSLRRALAAELGVDPSPETEDLYLCVLAPDVAPTSPGVAGGRPTSFLGRDDHLVAIAGAWERVRDGRARTVLVTGESGIGKTRLMIEAARPVAKAGHVVLLADCSRAEPQAFRPIIEAVGSYLAATPDDLLPPLNAATMRTLHELLGQPVQDGSLRIDATKVLMTLIETVRAISTSRPLLLIVDDVDMADDHTLMFLRYAMRRCNDCRLLIVMASGAAAAPSEVCNAVIEGLRLAGALVTVHLEGLGERDVRTMIGEVHAAWPAEDRPLAHEVMTATAGNPFLVNELISWDGDGAVGGVPETIVAYVRRRLGALTALDAAVLRLAACAGEQFEQDVVGTAAAIDADRASGVVERLIAEGLLERVERGRLCFRHEVVRQTVEAIEDRHERRRHHELLADALEARRRTRSGGPEIIDPSDPVDARQIGAHRVAAVDALAATTPAPDAITRAGDHLPPQHAARLYRRALTDVVWDDRRTRAELLLRLGRAERTFDVAQSSRTLFDAAIVALEGGCGGLAAEAALDLALTSTGGPMSDAAAALIDEVIEYVAPQAGLAAVEPCVLDGPVGRVGSVDPVVVGRLVAQQVRTGQIVASATTACAAACLAAALAALGPLAGARGRLARSAIAGDLRAVAIAASAAGFSVAAAHHLAMAASFGGDVATVGAEVDRLRRVADRSRQGDALVGLVDDHATARIAGSGWFGVAWRDPALRWAAATGADRSAAAGWATGAGLTPAPGALVESGVLTDAWLRAAHRPPAPAGSASAGSVSAPPTSAQRPAGAIGMADAALRDVLRGDRGRALVTMSRLLDGLRVGPHDDATMHVAGVLAIVAVELGHEAAADAIRGVLEPHGDAVCGVGYRSFLGPAALHLGRIATLHGEWNAAETSLCDALGQLAERGASAWLALAQRSLAELFERRGRRSDAPWAASLRAEAALWPNAPDRNVPSSVADVAHIADVADVADVANMPGTTDAATPRFEAHAAHPPRHAVGGGPDCGRVAAGLRPSAYNPFHR